MKSRIEDSPSETNNYVLRLSLRCNVSCIYCNIFKNQGFKEKKLSEIEQTVRNITPPEVLITGGEPTCIQDLPRIIKILKKNKKTTCLQTNAILCSDKKYTNQLKRSGLDRAFVSLPSHIPKKTEYIMNKKNIHEKIISGIKNLNTSGIDVNLCHVLTTINYPDFPDFIDFVHNTFPFVKELDLMIVQKVGKAKNKPWLIPSLTKIYPFLLKAKGKGYTHPKINNAFTIPLCYFGLERSLDIKMNESLYLRPSKRQKKILSANKIKAKSCGECIYDNLCSGVWKGYEDVHGFSELKPIKHADKNYKPKIKEQKNGRGLLIRQSLKCNQNCKFCNIRFETGFKEKTKEEILLEISKKRPESITITGGEPTLHSPLFSIIKFAKAMGTKEIGIQTNAILCSYFNFSKKLKEAGLTDALVSLHSNLREVSDYLTESPGSWDKTIQGIDNLISLGIGVRIAHVINSKNYKQLSKFVIFINNKFPLIRGIDLIFNQQRGRAISHKELLPRLSDIKTHINQAIKTAKDHNLELVNAFGLPFCYWGKYLNHEYDLLSKKKKNQVQIPSLKENKVMGNQCTHCAEKKSCLGIWKGYAKIYGTSELIPITKKK